MNYSLNHNVSYAQLAVSFFKIGAFTIGGGFAMIPLMEKELVDNRCWISREEFMDLLSLGQSMPGIFAVNMASSIGYKLRGVGGAISAILGNIFMPICIILLLAIGFKHFEGNSIIEHIFMGIRPAVVALIAAPVFNLARTAHVRLKNCWIPLTSALLIWTFGVSPIWIIFGAIIGGILYRRIKS